MFEPWQPTVKKPPAAPALQPLAPYDPPEVAGVRADSNGPNQVAQPSAEQDGGSKPIVALPWEAKFLNDGTETLSDASPDPVLAGQQYAAGSSSGRPSRRGGLPETPTGRFLSEVFQGKLRRLAELEPNNRHLTRWEAPDYRPSQSDINRIDLEIVKALQRAPGAIDTQASGIGIGSFAAESIPARSVGRNWTEAERAEINRIGYRYGCHSCGSREPGLDRENFFMDHQPATRLNQPGQNQIILPHCMSCSVRQGGLISSTVRREKP
jgi:hypothetical protein